MTTITNAESMKNLTLETNADAVKKKLMSTAEWKIYSGYKKRKEYEEKRKQKKNVQFSSPEYTDLRKIESLDDIDLPKKPVSVKKEAKMSRYSKVFKKSTVSRTGSMLIGDKKMTKKDERVQLQELQFDKMFLNRMLWDEHIRILFLRSSKLNAQILKTKPISRLWMEAMMSRISEHSQKLRRVMKSELAFLKNRYEVQRQLYFWHTLHSLSLDQLYDRKRQKAFKKKIRVDQATESLNLIWRWFNKGLFERVDRSTRVMIEKIETWRDRFPNSPKFKLLSDMYYLRGLALTNLEHYDSAYKCFKRDGELGEFMDLQLVRCRTKDNIARILAIKGNYKQAIKIWNERFETIETPKEKAWVTYNIALCFALDDAYDKAIESINKSIKFAEQAQSYTWELNGHLLLANCSALIGSLREANVRSNTIISLRSLSRAYQCAVFLANVSVIQKIMEIAMNIYNSFKDVDVTILEENWLPNLFDYARKAATADAEINKNATHLNMSNVIRDSLENKSGLRQNLLDEKPKKLKKLIKSKSKFQYIPKNLRNQNNNQQVPIRKSFIPIVNNQTIVTVTTTEKENIKDKNKFRNNFPKASSPITAVEVITGSEFRRNYHEYVESLDGSIDDNESTKNDEIDDINENDDIWITEYEEDGNTELIEDNDFLQKQN